MTRRSRQLLLLAPILALALGALPGLILVTKALQASEIFTPASGHAEVIAQGVAALPRDVAWRTVFYSVAPGSTAELAADGPGFVLVDTGGILVDEANQTKLLAPSEAAFRSAATQLTPLGDRPAGLFAIDAVSPDQASATGSGVPVFAGESFPAPSGQRDIDLVRDLLTPGESTTVIGSETPVLVLVTLGAIQVKASDGSTASLRVGDAGTFSGDVVLTGQGQAPSTFVAAVIGREAPGAAGTPGATPLPAAVGSVQVTVYACPPLVTAQDASPGRCLRDPAAASLDLVSRVGEQSVGPSGERQGLPTWAGLPGGEYVLRASSFQSGFSRFLVRGLHGTDDTASQGYAAGNSGYVIPISADAADYSLEVYVLVTGESATPAPATATPAAEATATPQPAPVESPPSLPESQSVIQIETPAPGAAPTATPQPRPTATPRSRPTQQPAIVNSTAVARPSRGTVTVRIWGCNESIDNFDPANCAQASSGFDVQLVTEGGDIIGLSDATVGNDGSVTWKGLAFGTYVFQQPGMVAGAATYYAPDLDLAPDGAGYIVPISGDAPVVTVDIYDLPPSTAAQPTVAPAQLDSDGDGISDSDEINVYGTDPQNADTDFDGVFDGAEIAAGTNPLVADNAAFAQGGAADSDGDRLSDGDEAAFGTDPNNPDTDGDGWFDGDEVNLGTDPLDPNSFPSG